VIELLHSGELALYGTGNWIPAKDRNHHLVPKARKKSNIYRQAAAARLLDNNDNILRAEAAAYVYQVDEFNRGHIDQLPEAPAGLNLVDPKEIPGLENATFTSKKTGFGAALFESEINGEAMVTLQYLPLSLISVSNRSSCWCALGHISI